MSKYIFHNGRLISEDKAIHTSDNRAFLYGDSLFETIHSFASNIQYLGDHFERLTMGMKCLQMEIPSSFTLSNIENEISTLIIKNKYFKGIRIRINVWRNPGGLYTPSDNSISYIINCTELENGNYELNKKGYSVDIYEDISKHNNKLSVFKTGNCLAFIMASIHRKQRRLDDCILVNEQGEIVEAISSNLFIVKNNIIYTPSLSSGPVSGIMRKQIIYIARSLNIEVQDNAHLKLADLLVADEMFLSNAIGGIKWVVAFRDRRYFNRTGKLLSNELNRINNF